MTQLAQARELVRAIEARGGPPPEDAVTFERIKAALEPTSLGFPWLAALGIPAAAAWLGWVLFKTGKAAGEAGAKAAAGVIGAAERAAQTLIWIGSAWLVLDMLQKRRRYR